MENIKMNENRIGEIEMAEMETEALLRMRTDVETIRHVIRTMELINNGSDYVLPQQCDPFTIILADAIRSLKCQLKIDHLVEQLNTIKNVDGIITECLLRVCEHTYCDDNIDIDPDNSKHIIYCTKCYETLRP